MTRQTDTLALVADIGGTNTRVALCQRGVILPDTLRRYVNAEVDDLPALLSDFLGQSGVHSVQAACGAAAGPLRDEAIRLTNYDWLVAPEVLCQATGAQHGVVFNDLQAQAHGIATVSPDHQIRVLSGLPTSVDAPRLIVGLGTGFNISVLYPTPSGPIACPAEAGHARLTITDPQDWEVVAHIGKHGFASVEDLLSGKGLGRLYTLCAGMGDDGREQTSADALAAIRAGVPAALRARDIFCRILGNQIGDLALGVLPHGGIYMVGGMSQALADLLHETAFQEAFLDKGRFRPLMEEFPLTIITDDFAALNGCAHYINSLIP